MGYSQNLFVPISEGNFSISCSYASIMQGIFILVHRYFDLNINECQLLLITVWFLSVSLCINIDGDLSELFRISAPLPLLYTL